MKPFKTQSQALWDAFRYDYLVDLLLQRVDLHKHTEFMNTKGEIDRWIDGQLSEARDEAFKL